MPYNLYPIKALDWAYCNATCAAFNETCSLSNDSMATYSIYLTGLKLFFLICLIEFV